jgi:hypothetical protein
VFTAADGRRVERRDCRRDERDHRVDERLLGRECGGVCRVVAWHGVPCGERTCSCGIIGQPWPNLHYRSSSARTGRTSHVQLCATMPPAKIPVITRLEVIDLTHKVDLHERLLISTRRMSMASRFTRSLNGLGVTHKVVKRTFLERGFAVRSGRRGVSNAAGGSPRLTSRGCTGSTWRCLDRRAGQSSAVTARRSGTCSSAPDSPSATASDAQDRRERQAWRPLCESGAPKLRTPPSADEA